MRAIAIGVSRLRKALSQKNVDRGYALRRRPVIGGDVFDLQIVATMQANGVQRIYTFNTDDFEVFPELAVVTP